MKTLRKILAATVLTCVLSISALAGDMGTGVAQTPPPPPSMTGEMGAGSTATGETTVTGDMSTGVASTVGPIAESVLSLLQSVLALF